MATNGANDKKRPSSRRSRRTPQKATAAQLRAMRKYLRQTGHKFDPKRIEKIRALWAD